MPTLTAPSKAQPRARVLTVTAISGHVFSLSLRVERNSLGEPVCSYRINQFETQTWLVGGETPHLSFLGSEQNLPALRAQLGVTLEKGFNVPLAPETYAAVEAAAAELVSPFIPLQARLRKSAVVGLLVFGSIAGLLTWGSQNGLVHPAMHALYCALAASWLLLVRAIYLPHTVSGEYAGVRSWALGMATTFYVLAAGISLSVALPLLQHWLGQHLGSHFLGIAAGTVALLLLGALALDFRHLWAKKTTRN